jgi:hypothetical protein
VRGVYCPEGQWYPKGVTPLTGRSRSDDLRKLSLHFWSEDEYGFSVHLGSSV